MKSDDPIVKEVRNARREIEKESGGDFHNIYERALKIQKKWSKKSGAVKAVKSRRLSPA